jgi:4-alpha-glucanotransferase
MRRRASGILLHLSSLPCQYGIGDMGPGAYEWIDFLASAEQKYWQVLPLNPTTRRGHNSPYQCTSAFAGNPLFISPAVLRDAGLLTQNDLDECAALPEGRVDYEQVTSLKRSLLAKAFANFRAEGKPGHFPLFCERNAAWLDDYALFMTLRDRFDKKEWSEWPPELRDIDKSAEAIHGLGEELQEAVEREKFFQYLFYRQWSALKGYANRHSVRIIGDLPFYVGTDCADVWGNRHLFKLTDTGAPKFLAGVPPDRFSATGQLWDNPVYDWAVHAKDEYAWWMSRVKHNLERCGVMRIDHFRGFAAHWEVPGEDDTAANGRWVDGPGNDFFDTLFRYCPDPAFIAEDLGHITADVRELIRDTGFPSMKVLQFAFDTDSGSNPYVAHNHTPNSVVYPGTHDNNTTRGWFKTEATPEEKKRLRGYLGFEPSESEVHWDLIRLAMMSVSRLAIIPLQDVLGLDETARMNQPAVAAGNWEWRMRPETATPDVADRLARLTETYGRL